MTKSRQWSVGTAVVAVILLVASWFVLIAPQRSEAASLREQTSQQESFNEQVKLKTQQLKAQFASLPARQAQLAEIKQQMPENPALPSLVRDLSKYADQAGVVLVSVAPTAPVPLVTTATATTTQTAATAAGTAPIQQIQTTLVVTGPYAELTLYLQKVQSKMRRAILVDNIALVKATGQDVADGDLQMTVTGRVFVLDSKAAAQAAQAATAAVPSTGTAK